MRPPAPALLATLALAAAGCAASSGGGSAPATMPADFAVRYERGNGALPPPHHYEYTIRVGPGAGPGRVEFRPGYDSLPVWTESFPVGEAQLRSLYAVFRDRGVLDRTWREGEPAAGGEVRWLQATAAGRSVTLPARPRDEDRAALREVYAAVEALVPRGVLAGMVARQQQLQRAREAPGAAPVNPSSSPESTP